MNSFMYFLLAFLFVLQGSECDKSSSPLCPSVVSTLDCATDVKRVICGTNGVTYNTSCAFVKALCADSDLHVANEGPCPPKPQPDPICSSLVSATCPTISNPVCASDGMSYNNFCTFEQSKCGNVGLSLISLGPCPTTQPMTTTTLSIFEIICQSLDSVSCPIGQPKVCGSDGVTYDSGCDLEKANCKADGSIIFAKDGPC